jgi:hypothetical protein
VEAATWTVIGMLGATLAVVLGLLFQLGGRIDTLGARIDARLDAIEGRIDALSARIDGLSTRLDAHLDWHAGRHSS